MRCLSASRWSKQYDCQLSSCHLSSMVLRIQIRDLRRRAPRPKTTDLVHRGFCSLGCAVCDTFRRMAKTETHRTSFVKRTCAYARDEISSSWNLEGPRCRFSGMESDNRLPLRVTLPARDVAYLLKIQKTITTFHRDTRLPHCGTKRPSATVYSDS
jgi:hypothetical protein